MTLFIQPEINALFPREKKGEIIDKINTNPGEYKMSTQ